MKLPVNKFVQQKTLLVSLPLLFAAGLAVWWMLPAKMTAESRYVTATIERGAITQTVSANGRNPVTLVNVGSGCPAS
jgi:multidrug efflux pump subunit AcrA (membrane-fusion protein)